MNVDESRLKAYIERFHQTVDETAKRYLSADEAKKPRHRTVLPARIIGYISTQFGVAIEYVPASTTTIETEVSSSRIEELFFKPPKLLRPRIPHMAITGRNIWIGGGGTFADGYPLRIATEQADVTIDDLNFECEEFRWRRHVDYAHIYGDRSADLWTLGAAESRAKDEVLAALYLINSAKKTKQDLHTFVSAHREKYILVLGAFNPEGRLRLAIIRSSLARLGYEALIVDEFPEFEHLDLSQKVTVFGCLARFVIVDDTTPSGHILEISICQQNRWVTVVLRPNGKASSSMNLGLSDTSTVISELPYEPSNIPEAVSEAVLWAEARLTTRKDALDSLYPFRRV